MIFSRCPSFIGLFFSVVFATVFEKVLCSTYNVHRVVNNARGDQEKQHLNNSDHRYRRKSTGSYEVDNFAFTTPKNYGRNPRDENLSHGRRTQRKSSTSKYINGNLAEIIEITTASPQKLPVTIIEKSTFENVHPTPPHNSTLDYVAGNQFLKIDEKSRRGREKAVQNLTKGYEVYEEIVGDFSPPPQPARNIKNSTTLFPVVPLNLLENYIQETANGGYNDTYGKRINRRRNREYYKI